MIETVTPRKTIGARYGDSIAPVAVDSVVRFLNDGKIVVAQLVDGQSVLLPSKETIRELAVEFAENFVACAPGLLVRRLLLISYTQGSREEGGGGWLRLAGSAKLVRVTDSFRNVVAEAVVQRRIEIAMAGPSDAKVSSSDAYASGRDARQSRRPKEPPRGLDRTLRSWWMAGWNDADIETGIQA